MAKLCKLSNWCKAAWVYGLYAPFDFCGAQKLSILCTAYTMTRSSLAVCEARQQVRERYCCALHHCMICSEMVSCTHLSGHQVVVGNRTALSWYDNIQYAARCCLMSDELRQCWQQYLLFTKVICDYVHA